MHRSRNPLCDFLSTAAKMAETALGDMCWTTPDRLGFLNGMVATSFLFATAPTSHDAA